MACKHLAAYAAIAFIPIHPASALPGWNFTKRITINTAAAGVNADVPAYPLAVLLNGQNFPFESAQEGGADLRFTDASGGLLAFEIESWDQAGKSAAVWVKVDVKGNNASQYIEMHWGNPGAPGASDGKAVFADASGILGTWHLNQDGGTQPGGFKDASSNGFHGTGVLMPASSSTPGRIGKGTLFQNPRGGASGQIRWIEVAGERVLDEFGADTHPISVSIWAKANTWQGYYETFFARGDGEYSYQRDYQGRLEVCMSPASGQHHMCAIAGAPKTGTWDHHMIVRTNGPYASNKLDLYINGVKVAGTTAAGAHRRFPFGIANNSQNGRTRSQRGFDGILDECRVYKVEKNANWAKLEYESQKEGSTLLTFGPVTTSIRFAVPAPGGAESRYYRIFDLQGRNLESTGARALGGEVRSLRAE